MEIADISALLLLISLSTSRILSIEVTRLLQKLDTSEISFEMADVSFAFVELLKAIVNSFGHLLTSGVTTAGTVNVSVFLSKLVHCSVNTYGHFLFPPQLEVTNLTSSLVN